MDKIRELNEIPNQNTTGDFGNFYDYRYVNSTGAGL